MDRQGISVIVCCYNSSQRLAATLKHLALQQVNDNLLWEVILVDNASTDDTHETAQGAWKKYGNKNIDFQITDESRPGLSHAREKGIQTSKYEYLIFCDDDNWLHEDYLQIAFDTLSAKPQVAALGGRSTAVADEPLPEWFEASKNNYAVGRQAGSSGDVSHRKHLWGSGLALRKSLYRRAFAGYPSLLTGRKGQELSSGEDSELCMRFILMGYRLYYLETLRFEHYISSNRLNIEYSNKLMDGFIRAHAILSIYARFIDLKILSLQEKTRLSLKSAMRVSIMAASGLKRWNDRDEKLTLYILLGYKFRSIPEDIAHIRQLSAS